MDKLVAATANRFVAAIFALYVVVTTAHIRRNSRARRRRGVAFAY